MKRACHSQIQAVILSLIVVFVIWHYLSPNPQFHEEDIPPHLSDPSFESVKEVSLEFPNFVPAVRLPTEASTAEASRTSPTSRGTLKDMDQGGKKQETIYYSNEHTRMADASQTSSASHGALEDMVQEGNKQADNHDGDEETKTRKGGKPYEGPRKGSTLEVMQPVNTTPQDLKNPPSMGAGKSSSNSTQDSHQSSHSTNETYSSSSSHPKIKELKKGTEENVIVALKYVKSITDLNDKSMPRLKCPALDSDRYDYLQWSNTTSKSKSPFGTTRLKKPRYFIALDLYRCVDKLPTLMGSLVQLVKFLGPENCAVSVVEGRSDDGTYEVLFLLQKTFADLGTNYTLTTNELNPSSADDRGSRITALSHLRNQALEPLTKHPESYATNTMIIFINDVALCLEDLLELIHQYTTQSMDMICAMDWDFGGQAFYDVWVARSMIGDVFFEIPTDSNYDLFYNDPDTKNRFDARQPFQVYACWNGVSVIKAQPFMKNEVKFRRNDQKTDECFMGEPTLLCKDFWRKGLDKIAVAPSVNVAYNDYEARAAKAMRGDVRTNLGIAREKEGEVKEEIEWKKDPPKLVKCLPNFFDVSWVDALWP